MSPGGLRPELPPLPEAIAALPVHRGYPVPWFVAWVDGEPDFRVADRGKRDRAVLQKLCWVCGGRILIGDAFAFVVGPMCVVNRISGDPPSHRACAEWAIQACPFLARPHAKRRELDAMVTDGIMIKRNLGVSVLWLALSYKALPDGRGGYVLSMGGPAEPLQAFAEGRPAIEEEIRRSFDSGVPILRKLAAADGKEGRRALKAMLQEARARAAGAPS